MKGESKKRREKGKEHGWEEKKKATVGVVKDFDKGQQTGGGAAKESVKSTVKRLKDKTRMER